jgi:hypothetical protein
MTFPSGAVLVFLLLVAACAPAATDSPELPADPAPEPVIATEPLIANETDDAEAIEEIRMLLEDDFEDSLAELDALK